MKKKNQKIELDEYRKDYERIVAEMGMGEILPFRRSDKENINMNLQDDNHNKRFKSKKSILNYD